MKSLWIVVLLSMVMGCSGGDKTPPVSDADKLRAQVLLAPFKSKLVQALTTAVAEGPIHAIQFCNEEAPGIAAELNTGGVEMGRTSHRLRNPDNAPEAWMEPFLADYVAADGVGESQAIRLSDGRIGYVEPLYIKPVCLVCHGDAIADDVGQALAALYPGDQATGFKLSEFRGMAWVKMPVDIRANIAE